MHRMELKFLMAFLSSIVFISLTNFTNLNAKDKPVSLSSEIVVNDRPKDFGGGIETKNGKALVYISGTLQLTIDQTFQFGMSTRLIKDKKYIFVNSWNYDMSTDHRVFPVFGCAFNMYNPVKTGDGHFQMTAKRIEDKYLPKGVTVTPCMITILCSKHYTSFGTMPTQYPEHIHSESEATVIAKVPEKGEPTFEIEIPNGLRTVFKKAPAKVGDIVVFSKKGYKIVSFTPPNEKEKIIGWVELDPKFTPLHELIEKKIPFIDPLESKDEKKDKK